MKSLIACNRRHPHNGYIKSKPINAAPGGNHICVISILALPSRTRAAIAIDMMSAVRGRQRKKPTSSNHIGSNDKSVTTSAGAGRVKLSRLRADNIFAIISTPGSKPPSANGAGKLSRMPVAVAPIMMSRSFINASGNCPASKSA